MQLQCRLHDVGSYAGLIDGRFGPLTEAAVRAYQVEHGFAPTGTVDESTWRSVTDLPIPALRERCLQLTAALEGNEFGLVRGNWDGAGLTWGIIGFTLKHAELSLIVMEVFANQPEVLRSCFGDRTEELIARLQAPKREQEAWANSISMPPDKVKVAEPWRSAFKRFGEHEAVQAIQTRRAYEEYLEPARRTATKYGLATELGLALCFDIHVQNGGVDPVDALVIDVALKAHPPADERALRTIIANAVADNVRDDFREDVRARKLAIATGAGAVHGEAFTLRHWGLEELPSD